MSSSSGGDTRSGKSDAPTKVKTPKISSRGPDSGFTTVISKKNARKSNNSKSDPPSPEFQQIVENKPVLIASTSAFNYDNCLSTFDSPLDMDTDNINEPSKLNFVVSQNNFTSTNISINTDSISSNTTNNALQNNIHAFPSDYHGSISILVECNHVDKNLGRWHPVKAAKLFSTNYTGITFIKPAGFKKIKITFDSITNANACLKSGSLSDYGFSASIPTNLLYSFGVIKLDNDISECDFREGVRSPFPIVGFRRISVNKDGVITPTRIVELKFLSPKLPQHISMFNMLFDVNPSVRSPVQCNRFLRFGHTQKFCRSEPRCSHCGNAKHSIAECPIAQSTAPSCLYCKLQHVATDRSCQEWIAQKEIKKIMASENISYQDALIFKKNNCYTSVFKYSDKVNSQPPISNYMTANFTPQSEDFPNFPINDNHHFFNSKKPKSKARSVSPPRIVSSLPPPSKYSSPNDSYLKQCTEQGQYFGNKCNDLSWVHTLSNILADALINSPTLSSPFSPSALQSLIESSLHSLLFVPSSSDK